MLTREKILKELQEYSQRICKTPGEAAFYDYAGIKLYNLHKLGWSNWRELVIDAGLLPNKFDKTKYSHKELCDLFIKAIRKKGKWPTRGDLDVMHHIDSFPESGTFYNSLAKLKLVS